MRRLERWSSDAALLVRYLELGGSVPKVSVVVPNYNHARYLRQRLDSIYAQSFTDFEVILLDNASTDESVDIFE